MFCWADFNAADVRTFIGEGEVMVLQNRDFASRRCHHKDMEYFQIPLLESVEDTLLLCKDQQDTWIVREHCRLSLWTFVSAFQTTHQTASKIGRTSWMQKIVHFYRGGVCIVVEGKVVGFQLRSFPGRRCDDNRRIQDRSIAVGDN